MTSTCKRTGRRSTVWGVNEERWSRHNGEREGLLNARGTHKHTCSATKLKYLTTQQVEDNIHD